jgi:hypothetical protein
VSFLPDSCPEGGVELDVDIGGCISCPKGDRVGVELDDTSSSAFSLRGGTVVDRPDESEL